MNQDGELVEMYMQYGKAYGKASVDGRIMEGQWLRDMVGCIYPDDYDCQIHILDSGVCDTKLKSRYTAANKLSAYLGHDNCLVIEPHINAAGNGREWSKAGGHRIVHNGKGLAEEAAHTIDSMLNIHSPVETKSRGVTYYKDLGRDLTMPKMVKAAFVLPELFFMDNERECELGHDKQDDFGQLFRGFNEGWIG
jgi:hypothetical protein